MSIRAKFWARLRGGGGSPLELGDQGSRSEPFGLPTEIAFKRAVSDRKRLTILSLLFDGKRDGRHGSSRCRCLRGAFSLC